MGTNVQGEEQYHLKWNDYNSSLNKCFRDLRDNEEMLDVTLISQGQTFKAHKLVLSACSPVFKSMLKRPSQQPFLQPFIFLHNVRREDIQAILDFMYNGEVSVSQDDLRSFLGVAEELRVRGLTQMDVDSNKTEERSKEELNKKRKSSEDHEDILDPKRYLSSSQDEEPVIQEPDFNGHSSPYQGYNTSSPSSQPRASNSMESPGLEPTGQVSYHRLGGRDVDDPLSNVVVTHSDRGWHCPDCIHIATTKGNLKSHILSGRHKVAEKNFKCRFCDRSYSTRQSLQVHISTNHRRERDLEMKPGHHHSSSEDFFHSTASAKFDEDDQPEISEHDFHQYYDSQSPPAVPPPQ